MGKRKSNKKVVVLCYYGKRGYALVDYCRFVERKAWDCFEEVVEFLGYEGADFSKLIDKAMEREGFIVDEKYLEVWTVLVPEKDALKRLAEECGFKVISATTLGRKINEFLLKRKIKCMLKEGKSRDEIWRYMKSFFYGNLERFEKVFKEVQLELLHEKGFKVASELVA